MSELPINKVLCGDAVEVLKTLADESIDCVITSPPYWALRDYQLEPQIWDGDEKCEHQWGEEKQRVIAISDKRESEHHSNRDKMMDGVKSSKGNFCSSCSAWRGSLGLEPTFELYLKHLLQIFDEIKRVLKKTGTCWVNLGDSYSGSGNGTNDYRTEASKSLSGKRFDYNMMFQAKQRGNSLPAKSLCLIPQRFAIGMVDRGWIIRNKLIWWKRNCMPSSVKDRFTVDFEDIIFMVKSNNIQYWVNEKTGAITDKQPLGTKGIEGIDWDWKIDEAYSKKPKKSSHWSGRDYWFEQQYEAHEGNSGWAKQRAKGFDNCSAYQTVGGGKWGKPNPIANPQGRNRRCVWDIPTRPFKGSHFAVFPETLVEPMIKAGCPEFICRSCGKGREKIIRTDYDWQTKGKTMGVKQSSGQMATIPGHATKQVTEIGYTDCGCNAGWTSGIVLDPFAGSHTTAVVAKKLKRKYIMIDLSPDYCAMGQKRLANTIEPLL